MAIEKNPNLFLINLLDGILSVRIFSKLKMVLVPFLDAFKMSLSSWLTAQCPNKKYTVCSRIIYWYKVRYRVFHCLHTNTEYVGKFKSSYTKYAVCSKNTHCTDTKLKYSVFHCFHTNTECLEFSKVLTQNIQRVQIRDTDTK